MRSLYKGHSLFIAKMNDPVRNPHRQDEMPKNKPSKIVAMHCSVKSLDWLQDSTSFGGHSRPKGGHRQVSGLVRASLKREARKLIHQELLEYKEQKNNDVNRHQSLRQPIGTT